MPSTLSSPLSADAGRCGIVDTRQSKVENLHVAGGRAHQVLGFEIPVDDAALVRDRQRPRDVEHGLDRARRHERAARELIPQRLAGHVLAGDVQVVVDFLEREHRRDAGVMQRCRRARFAPQPFTAGRIADKLRRDRLERDRASEPRVLGEVNDAHAAFAEHAANEVGADSFG